MTFADDIGHPFVLSLDPERIPSDTSDLLGDAMNVMPALDARSLSEEDVVSWCLAQGVELDLSRTIARERVRPTPTQIACAIGHHLIYEQLIGMDGDFALVLEDDVAPTDHGTDLSPAVAMMKRPTPTIVQLSCRGEVFARSRDWRGSKPQGLVPLCYPPRQTCAYLINRQAAALAAERPVDGLADWPSFATQVDFYALLPWPFQELNNETTIQLPPSRGDADPMAAMASRYLPASWSADYLYRTYLPAVDAWIWRHSGSRRIGPRGEIWRSSIPSFMIDFLRRGAARHDHGG